MGNIYVYGADYFQTHGGSSQNYFYNIFCKYDSLGSLIWKDTITHNVISAVTDSVGNTYCISGGTKVIKYNSQCQLLWWSASTNVALRSIALHPNGGVVVSGGYNDGDTTRAIVSRCDTSGNLLWSTPWYSGRAGDLENALACDLEGNTYFTGGYDPNASTFNKGILAKFDNAGNIISTMAFPVAPCGIKVDKQNYIYLLPYHGDDIDISGVIYPESLDYFLIKYDQSGNVMWHKTFSSAWLDMFHINLDVDNNVFIAGTFRDSIKVDNVILQEKNRNVFVIKMDENANLKWIKNSTGAQGGANSRDFVVNSRGEIFVTGEAYGIKQFGSSTTSVACCGYPDLFIAKIKDGSNNLLNIEEKKTNGHLLIYPNPTSKEVFIRYENAFGKKDLILTIVNMTGQKLFSETYSDFTGTFSKQLDLSNYAKGVYFIELRSGEAVETKKIILE